MSNGFTVEDVLREIKTELTDLNKKMDDVVKNGCAHRSDDVKRIEKLEDWKTRGIIGIIALAVGLVVDLLTGGK